MNDVPAGGARANRWALVPVVLLGALVALQLLLLRSALGDPSFSVENDYYLKAADWDRTVAQEQANARLGWTFEAQSLLAGRDGHLIVSLRERHGMPVTNAQVFVEAFAIARGEDGLEASLSSRADGTLEIRLPGARPGLWEIRLRADRGADRVTHTMRVELPAHRGAP